MSPHKSINRHAGNDSSIVDRTSRTRLTWSFATDIKPNSNGPHATDRTRDWPWTDLVDSRSAPGSCPLRGGPLELGLMSVAKLQVSLVRLVRSTMLELLPLCLFMDFCELTKPDSISPNQIGTPLRVLIAFADIDTSIRVVSTFCKNKFGLWWH